MSEPTTDQEIAYLMDQVKDTLATLAAQVYAATEDGKISFDEGLMFGVTGTTAAMQLVSVYRRLSRESVKQLIDVLQTSDLKIG